MLHKDGERAVGEADLLVHERFFQEDDGEIFLARDARDPTPAVCIAGSGQDLRPLVLGTEGVLDADGDIHLAHGEDGLAVQHVCAHVGELAQLLVGEGADGHGIFYNPGIARQKSADVRPVFVQVRTRRPRDDGARNVAAAAGEGLDPAVCVLAVKTRDQRALLALERLRKQRVGALVVQLSVGAELDDVARIDEGDAQKLRHDPPGEVLPARCAEVGRRLFDDRLARLGEDGVDIHIQLEF